MARGSQLLNPRAFSGGGDSEASSVSACQSAAHDAPESGGGTDGDHAHRPPSLVRCRAIPIPAGLELCVHPGAGGCSWLGIGALKGGGAGGGRSVLPVFIVEEGPSSNGRSADDLARGRRCECDRRGGVVGGGVRGEGWGRRRELRQTPLPDRVLCALCPTPARPSPCRARRRGRASVRTSRRGRRRGGAPCSCRREARPSSGSGGAG